MPPIEFDSVQSAVGACSSVTIDAMSGDSRPALTGWALIGMPPMVAFCNTAGYDLRMEINPYESPKAANPPSVGRFDNALMHDELVTVANYRTAVEAHLVRARLESVGIAAVVADEASTTAYWLVSNSMGGVKVRVLARDLAAAEAVLSESHAEDLAGDESEDEQPESDRQKLVNRAFRAAVFGMLFAPLEFYAFWLLLQVCVSREPLDPRSRKRSLAAAAICLPMMFVQLLILRTIFHP